MHLRAMLVVLAAIFFGLMPIFASEYEGLRTDQFLISQENSPIKPALYTAYIWGVIYPWLVAGMTFGLFFRTNTKKQFPRWDKMRRALLVSLAIGMMWLPATNINPIWSTFLLWLMLLSALKALYYAPSFDRIWARGPVSIYAGWLTVLSSVSLGLSLAGYGVMTAHNSAILILFIMLICAASVQITLGTAPLFGTTIAWGLMGIVVANITASSPDFGVAGLSGIGIVFMLGLSLWARYRRRFTPDEF
jgi:hypothetical protein